MNRALFSFLFVAAALSSQCALAITVTTTNDSGAGSLRAAIASAPPGATIDFAVTGTITLTSGELLINKSLKIVGPGATNLTVRRSTTAATPAFRIFHITGGAVTISGLTVSNGRLNGIYDDGAGILNGDSRTPDSSLTLNDCVVSENTATGEYGYGAGVFCSPNKSLIVSNCVFSANATLGRLGVGGAISGFSKVVVRQSKLIRNAASAGGGGLFVVRLGSVEITDSTIADNTVTAEHGNGGGLHIGVTGVVERCTFSGNVATGNNSKGGGLYSGATTRVVNCTFSDNSASGTNGQGGAIYNRGTLSVDYCTITGNSAPGVGAQGGGIYHTNTSSNLPGSLFLHSSILVGNVGHASTDADIRNDGAVASGGHNLIGTWTGNPVINPRADDQSDVDFAAVKLGPLQDNGGPTLTHGLLPGSPAIDAGGPNRPETDQRGVRRPIGPRTDIGAFEGVLTNANSAPTITCPAPATLECANGAPVTVSVNAQDADGDPLTIVWIVDGVAYQTNTVPAGGPPTQASVEFTANFESGEHEVQVFVTDGKSNSVSCSTIITVRDMTPPAIQRVSAMPSVLWPPDHRLVPVRLQVRANDNCGPVTCKIKSVRSNEPSRGHEGGWKAPDWIITGDLSLRLRAERSGRNHERVYTITVECTDAAGNKSTRDTTVTVPHDRRKSGRDDDRQK